MGTFSKAELEAMIEEATVDAYNEDEQLTGLFTLLEEHLAVPFTTTAVLGVEVTVRGVDLAPDGRIVALCSRGGMRQSIGILELPLPRPAPEGAEWIDAYRHWAG
ncbi:calcium-binding protein [Streptomyces odonnellii]|uniref:calcium-binding protein n=1 Tax=Streptomyces odonnellii TaxID=1417980 RepID=UPI000625374A|nr:calcium-binding protein [Streptomyces odonnellii]